VSYKSAGCPLQDVRSSVPRGGSALSSSSSGWRVYLLTFYMLHLVLSFAFTGKALTNHKYAFGVSEQDCRLWYYGMCCMCGVGNPKTKTSSLCYCQSIWLLADIRYSFLIVCYNDYKSGESQCRLENVIPSLKLHIHASLYVGIILNTYSYTRNPKLMLIFNCHILPKPDETFPSIDCPLPPIPIRLLFHISDQVIVITRICRWPQQILWYLVLLLVAVVEQ